MKSHLSDRSPSLMLYCHIMSAIAHSPSSWQTSRRLRHGNACLSLRSLSIGRKCFLYDAEKEFKTNAAEAGSVYYLSQTFRA